MTLTELRKRLPGWEIKTYDADYYGHWWGQAEADSGYEVGDDYGQRIFVEVFGCRTRKEAVAALAEKLDEIGVLK